MGAASANRAAASANRATASVNKELDEAIKRAKGKVAKLPKLDKQKGGPDPGNVFRLLTPEQQDRFNTPKGHTFALAYSHGCQYFNNDNMAKTKRGHQPKNSIELGEDDRLKESDGEQVGYGAKKRKVKRKRKRQARQAEKE